MRPAQPQSCPQRVGVDIDTANEDLDGADVARRKRLAQSPFAVGQLLENFEPAHVLGQPIAGQVGDIGVELPQPVSGGVVPHQTCAHHRAVGVDDPPAGRRHRAVVGVGVGDAFAGVQHRRPTGHSIPSKARRPQARLAHAARQRSDLDLPVESQTRQLIEIDSGSALYDEVSAPVHIQQCIQRRRVVAGVEPAPSAAAPGGVDEDDGVAGDRPQRVGATEVDVGDIVACHRQPDRIDIAADHAERRIPQCRKLGADRTRRVVHRARQPTCPMRGDRCGGGLL